MEAVKALMRLFSYVFHALLALFLISISALALTSGADSLQLDMLPWSGTTLAYVLFFAAIVGLLAVLLAIAGKLRPLFFIWALVVAGFMVKGFVFSTYHFREGEVKPAVYLIVAALIALPGAWFQLRAHTQRKKLRGY